MGIAALIVWIIGGLLVWTGPAWAVAIGNPSPGALKSGVGLVSGWVCDAEELEISFDGGPRLFVPYGSERPDTAGGCGDTDNGFGLLWNYNELGDGPHTVTLYVDGVFSRQARFTVTTLGTNFLRGVTGSGRITLSDGKQVTVQWEEATQGFTIAGYTPGRGGTTNTDEQALRGLIGTWDFAVNFPIPLNRPYVIQGVDQSSSGEFYAYGTDQVLDRSLVLVLVLDDDEYRFFMTDVDTLDSGYACSFYAFNRVGNRLEGEAELTRSDGPSIGDCHDDAVAVGTFTATRR